MSIWSNTIDIWKDEAFTDDEGYFSHIYPRNVARAFIWVSYDDRTDEEKENHWRPYHELIFEAMDAFALRWGGLSDATFLRVLREAQGADRLVALFAIGHSHLPEADEVLLPFLESPDLFERCASANCLALRKNERALPVLEEYFRTECPVDEMGLPPREVLYWYDHQKVYLTRFFATWGSPEVVPILRRYLFHLWEKHPRYGPDNEIQDVLMYTLGRRGAMGVCHGMPLPGLYRRLAMVYLALGALKADERFADISHEVFVNKQLEQEVRGVLQTVYGLSEEESQTLVDNVASDNLRRNEIYNDHLDYEKLYDTN
ncbi:HEAT repeat domain-containing protein [Tengunoibacter tsumagoiensis]|uniref:Uncharacterized protein n=1 Tax=Tengunoibacter tsumagoiensis TaxID=2014871 RepID=A0A401ZYV6_9CHLR|nr:HEAT repeat domain-containing protein [Tengunoibacter tsumagoiensis]GCE12013.1 hypothetical protein KTT_18720 [Tengunoibacter tsumagoiensis]